MKESTVIHLKGTKERGDKAEAGNVMQAKLPIADMIFIVLHGNNPDLIFLF